MLPFNLTPLGAKILSNYCNRNPLFEVLIINEPDGDKGFVVRMNGLNKYYKLIKAKVLFKVERDEKVEGLISDEEQSEDFYLYPNMNLYSDLEIEELNKLVDIMELCRDKSEDD